MRVNPRLLVVKGVASSEGNQTLDLLLLDREASAEFKELFPDAGSRDRAIVVAYAEEHREAQRPGTIDAHTWLDVKETGYYPGDIFTEAEAFGLGYREPYIDTLCANIAATAMGIVSSPDALTHEKEKELSEGLTKALREAGYIGQDQNAVIGRHEESIRLDVVPGDQTWIDNVPGRVDEKTPIRLLIEPEPDKKQVRVAYEVFHGTQKRFYEYITFLPTK